MPKTKEVVSCSLCNGHGWWNGKICPSCNGAGKFIEPGPWDYCGACNGKGSVLVSESKNDNRTYTYSSHKGTVKPCPSCGGAGKIFRKTK